MRMRSENSCTSARSGRAKSGNGTSGGWELLSFTVFGTPVPQGSSRAFIPKGWTRAVITSANSKLKPWRQEIAGTAKAEMESRGLALCLGAVRLEAKFFFDRPKSLKKSALHKVTKPDVDKLLRALGDSLTGIVFKDDSQICECVVLKAFGSPSRVEVTVKQPE
jgi:crossover junction endodeoxyribonuclease RusA